MFNGLNVSWIAAHKQFDICWLHHICTVCILCSDMMYNVCDSVKHCYDNNESESVASTSDCLKQLDLVPCCVILLKIGSTILKISGV